jgi:poly-gamma-glutamate capsule biosynthesis protein CapA/YwtB (metallophosphatase superfamily)
LGDVMLGRGVGAELAKRPPEEVWSEELCELLRACDLVVCNLECCISERGAPTELVSGKPFFFRGPPAAVESLRAIGVDAVGLANNHALDYGSEALEDTLELLGEAAFAVAGAGRGPDEARRGVVVEASRFRLGLVAVSDHPREFAAGAGSPGIAYAELDRAVPDWLVAEVAAVRERAGAVLAFPHWGPNMTVRPARWQRGVAARLLEAGADLVAGHSAHCFHGVERIGGRLVAYDLGDALDDYAVDARLRNDLGLLGVWRPDTGELDLVGLRLDYSYTRLASGPDAEWIAERLERACGELGTPVERTGDARFRVTAA